MSNSHCPFTTLWRVLLGPNSETALPTPEAARERGASQAKKCGPECSFPFVCNEHSITCIVRLSGSSLKSDWRPGLSVFHPFFNNEFALRSTTASPFSTRTGATSDRDRVTHGTVPIGVRMGLPRLTTATATLEQSRLGGVSQPQQRMVYVVKSAVCDL